MLRILILDDDLRFGHSLKRALEGNRNHSYVVVAVTTAADALREVQQSTEPFDVFLIDQRLGPGKDGLDVFLDLRQYSPETDAIIFTVVNDESVVQRSYQVGAFRYLHKPLRVEELILVLESLYHWRQQQRERDWLRIIQELALTTQSLISLADIGPHVASFGQQLGFEHVRLWRYDTQQNAMISIYSPHTDGQDACELDIIPAHTSRDVQRVLASRDLIIDSDSDHLDPAPDRRVLDTHNISSHRPRVLVPLWGYSQNDGHEHECLGMLVFDQPTTHGIIREDQRQALTLLGNQVSAVLQRDRLYGRIRALADIGKAITSHSATDSLPQLLDRVYEQVAKYMVVPGFLVVLWDDQGQDPNVALSIHQGRRRRYVSSLPEEALLKHMIQRNESLLLLGGERAYCLQHNIAHSGRGARCWLGAPLRLGTTAIGAVVVKSYTDERAYTQADLELLQAAAEQIAGAISAARQKVQAEATSRKRSKEVSVLQGVLRQALNPEIHQAILEQISLETQTTDKSVESMYRHSETLLARLLLDAAHELLNDGTMQVALILRHWEPDPRTGHPREIRNQYIRDGQHGVRVDRGLEQLHGVTGWAFQHQRDCLIRDVHGRKWRRHFYPGVFQDTVSEMVVLITLNGAQPLGLFNVESPYRGTFKPKHQKTLKGLAAVAALVLDNLYRQVRLRSVLEAARAMVTPYELEKTLNAVINAAQVAVTNLPGVTIWYRSPVNGAIVPGPYFGVSNRRGVLQDSKEADTPVTRIMQSREPVWAEDVPENEVLHSRFVAEEGIKSAVALPLIVDDEAVGVIFFNYHYQHTFTPEEKVLFTIFAQVAAASIRDALHLAESEAQRQRLNAALDITRTVGSSLEIHTVLAKILQTLHRVFPHTQIAVLLYDAREQKLLFRPESREYYHPDQQQSIISDAREVGLHISSRSLATFAARRVLETGQHTPINVDDVQTHPQYLGVITSTHSQLTVPLTRSDPQHSNAPHDCCLLGVLVLERSRVRAFSPEEVALMSNAGQQISLAIERAQQNERLQQSNAALQQSNDELQQSNEVAQNIAWAFQMSHDIPSKISRIYHSLGTIPTENLPPEDAEAIDIAIRDVREIQDIVKVAKDHVPEDVNLDDWLEWFLDQHLERRQRRIPVRKYMGCTGLQAQIITFYFKLVLQLIVDNALEAMEAADEQAEHVLEIQTRPVDDTTLEVRVTDTGPGIPDDIKPHVFRRSVSTKQDNRGKGLLFAHWITKVIIKGQIEITDRETGRGTVCVFTIPATQSLEREAPDD
jgi:GAF domain-containing protein